MRKFFWLILCIAFLLTGCRKAETVPVSGAVSMIQETAAETITETKAEFIPFAERAEKFRNPEYEHIYDECGALNQEECSLHNSYLEWIASSRLVNAFVVITDNLNDIAPQQFAESYYQEIFDITVSDGFLVLINNDTNQDIIYTAGRCQNWITQTEISIVLNGATRDLIEGRFSDALNRILPVSEQMPAYILDKTAALSEYDMQELSEKIRLVQENSGIQCAVVLLPFPEENEPDVIVYQTGFNCDMLLLLDPETEQCRIIGESPLSESEFLAALENQGLYWAFWNFLEDI